MARIRTIKPEFFTSEDIVALSPMARLLYIALWCEADKRGRLLWKPKTFKMRWLPGDKCDIAALCAELVDGGLVVLYGDDLAHIPGFEKHQHVNPRETESSLPDPDGWRDTGPRKVGKNLREAVFERDGYKCVRCGSDDHPQADHILPQSCGGPHSLENLRTLCRSCNAGRPVAGAALEADLAKDGFTLESLRVKFGIDASIPELHAQGGREGKGKERKEGVIQPAARTLACPEGVDQVVWADWLQLRKAKRAPVTATVIAEAVREAEKAGMSLSAFLGVWCSRGSQGLQADWLKPNERAGVGKIAPVAPSVEVWKPPPPMTPEEKAASDEARRRAMTALKRIA